jgi:hypothetical protein
VRPPPGPLLVKEGETGPRWEEFFLLSPPPEGGDQGEVNALIFFERSGSSENGSNEIRPRVREVKRFSNAEASLLIRSWE